MEKRIESNGGNLAKAGSLQPNLIAKVNDSITGE